MVVISAAILTREGRILFARQFLEITRVQLEALLGSFIRLIDSSMQHTFLENETTRFVYIPLDNIYLVLLTSKDSNIVDDLETLRLLQKVVQHYCPYGLSDGSILKSSFEISWAFDDVISMGYRESVTLAQILSYAEMESAEEKAFKEKLEAQIQEAKEASRKKQQELDKLRVIEAQKEAERASYSQPVQSVSVINTTTEMAPTIIKEAPVVKETAEPAVAKRLPKKGMDLKARKVAY
jgi:hypothetical protein